MNSLQKQLILISHAIAITLAIPLLGASMRWSRNLPDPSSSASPKLFAPTHRLEAHLAKDLQALNLPIASPEARI